VTPDSNRSRAEVIDLAVFRRSPRAIQAAERRHLFLSQAPPSLTGRQLDHRRRMLKHLGGGLGDRGASPLAAPDLPLFGQIG
jgi:hypothetical protein